MEQVQRITQAYTQAPWRKQMQILGLLLAILVFAAVVAGIYLNVTARAASIGREIQQMQREMIVLRQSNADLESKLAAVSSASEMERRARGMGFQPIAMDQEILYVQVPGYVKRRPATLAPFTAPPLVSAPVLPAEYTESLFEWLQRELRLTSLLESWVKP
jgi:cell division protein FtsL